jgi:iron-sulfur cluster repair protein YtfE (RIC family)
MTAITAHTAHAQHDEMVEHVDRMPALGDLLLTATADELGPRLEVMDGFLTGTLLPHMDASEPVVFPELERLMQNRHSMTPLRREHAEIRRLAAQYSRLRPQVRDAKHSLGKVLAIRRTIFALYSLLKVHLAEENFYIDIIERGAEAKAEEVVTGITEQSVAVDA